MRPIITNTTTENRDLEFDFNNQAADLKEIRHAKETRPAIVREPDFAELHDSFEIQYQEFLTDTSDEIAKCAQRLSELKTIVYRDPRSGGIPYPRAFKLALPLRQGA